MPAVGAENIISSALREVTDRTTLAGKETRHVQARSDLPPPLADLLINPYNAPKQSKAQIAKIAASIKSFGFNVPVLIDEKSQLIAGHGRIEAAKQLGLLGVPRSLAHSL